MIPLQWRWTSRANSTLLAVPSDKLCNEKLVQLCLCDSCLRDPQEVLLLFLKQRALLSEGQFSRQEAGEYACWSNKEVVACVLSSFSDDREAEASVRGGNWDPHGLLAPGSCISLS